MPSTRGADALEILEPIKLAGLELAGLERRFDDHVDDGRRKPVDPYDIGAKLLIQRSLEAVKDLRRVSALRQIAARRELFGKYLHHALVAVLGRRHRLDDIAGILRMVVAVVADEFALMLVGREKSRLAFFGLDHVEIPVAVFDQLVRLEELPPLVHLECAGLFLLVNDVRRGAGRDANRVRRKFVHIAGFLEFAGLGDVLEPLENKGFHGVEFVGNGLCRVHALDKIDAFFERFLHFFVIEAIGGRILQALAVNQRNAAPILHHRDEIRLLAGGRGTRAFLADLFAVLEKFLQHAELFLVEFRDNLLLHRIRP